MPTDTFSTRDLLADLEGERFVTYTDLHAAVRESLRAHRAAFPLSYTAQQAIRWGRRNGLIVDGDDGLSVRTVGGV